MTLKEIRLSFGITQAEAARRICVPLRTYIRYEVNPNDENLKYQKMVELLKEAYEVSKNKGVYSLNELADIIVDTLDEYRDSISFCYLFGSYAKGYAKDESDVNICLDTSLTGIRFSGLVERLHQALKKDVDVIRFSDLKNNFELIGEIMKDGIKIYG